MKKINDLSVFKWSANEKKQMWGSVEFYHRPNRKFYRFCTLSHSKLDKLLYIDCFCEVHLLNGAHYMRKNAPFLSLEYVKSGTLYVRQNERAYELNSGDIFLMRPDCESEFISGEAGCQKISVLIDGLLVKEYLKSCSLNEIDVLSYEDIPKIEEIFRKISTLIECHVDDSNYQNSLLAFELLQALQVSNTVDNIPRDLKKLHTELALNFNHKWTIQEMAHMCHCSETHFQRIFVKSFKITPYQFLFKIRMERSERFLCDLNFSIKEIANKVGFDNSLNFSTAFRKYHGISPMEYRKKQLLF